MSSEAIAIAAEAQREADRFRDAVDSLPPREPTLRQLWIAAAEASEAFGQACGQERISNDEFTRLEAAALEADYALRDFLLTEHGLTSADLRRLGL